jgi:cell division transport system permease protein
MKMFFDHERYLGTKDLLPTLDKRETALHYVIGVLWLLASLAALIGLASDRAAQGWSREIRSEVTLQVRPRGLETATSAAAKAAETISAVPGVAEAVALEPEKAKALIKPWLGDAILEDLPIPNLVEVRLDPEKPATVKALEAALKAGEIDASIDDHSLWLKDIERSALTIRLISITVFLVVGSAAAAVVSFATRAGLVARAEVVEVLSLCGATDLFIAKRFQYRFARMAFESSLMGAATAGVIIGVIKLTQVSQSFTLALPFSWSDLLILLPCPVIAAIVAAFSARVITLRLLRGA